MNPTVVANVKSVIVEKLNADARRFVKFADVRYDSNNGSTIYYHDTVSSFSSSVDSHPPSKSLVFPDWTSNTDIFPVLESFLNNANSSLCGSFAVVLMKRYNQTGDDFGMFPELLTQRITVNFIQSNYMPEQGYIGCMRHVAGHSGGLFVESGQKGPENDASFPNITRLLMGDSDRLIYSSYPSWLGNVTNLQLEQLKVPKYGQKFVNVTLAVTAEILTEYSLQSITLKIVNRATSQTTSLIYTQKDYYGDSDLIWKTIQLETGSESDVYLDFRTSYGGIVAIRMFIDKPLPGDWNQPEAVLWNANRRNLLAANPAN